MLYYDTKLQARQSEGQVARRGLDASLGLSHYGIYPMSVAYPEGFDFELYSAIDGGDAGDATTGYRVDWKEQPKEHVAVVETLKGRVAAKRYTIETGGVDFGNGSVVQSDREDQSMINGAITFFALNTAVKDVDFKAKSGWVKMTKAQVTAIAGPIGLFVQACFSRERAICEAIDAAGEDTVAAITAYKAAIDLGWPENSVVVMKAKADAEAAAAALAAKETSVTPPVEDAPAEGDTPDVPPEVTPAG